MLAAQAERLNPVALDLSGAADLTSLDPLAGLPPTELVVAGAAGLASLEPLRSMLLTSLDLVDAPHITSLEPLRGMPLTRLYLIRMTGVASLNPLAGLPLTVLNLNEATGVTARSQVGRRRLRRPAHDAGGVAPRRDAAGCRHRGTDAGIMDAVEKLRRGPITAVAGIFGLN